MGASQQIDIAPNDKVRYLLNGIELDGEISFAEWDAIGVNLASIAAVTPWLIGDWYNFGDGKFGEMAAQAKAIADAVGGAGWQLKPETVQTYAYMCRSYSIADRIEALSFQHHRLVQADPKRAELLTYAAEHDMTTKEFRSYLSNLKGGGSGEGSEQKKTPAEVRREIVAEIGELITKALEQTDLILTDDTQALVELLHAAQEKIDRYLG